MLNRVGRRQNITAMDTRFLDVPIEYRKMSDRALEKEQAYLLHQISISLQRISQISVMLCMGQKNILTGTKLVGDLQAHYCALEALTEEKQYRQIP